MAGDGFKLNALPVGEDAANGFKYDPLPPSEIEEIRQQAEFLRSKMSQSGTRQAMFDAVAVKTLSDEVNSIRGSLDEQKKEIIANVYGMFLGEAMLRANPTADGKWVRMKSGDIAICWQKPKGDMAVMFSMPITRVFKQLEHGETYSMYSLFLSMPRVLSGETKLPPSPQRASANPTASRNPTTASKAPVSEGWFSKLRRLLNRI
jgi:hypothetical protein